MTEKKKKKKARYLTIRAEQQLSLAYLNHDDVVAHSRGIRATGSGTAEDDGTSGDTGLGSSIGGILGDRV